VYELDEDGNRIRDADGKFVFNAVPTTDWGSPETLEYWRQTWAELCNAKFAEKGIDVRIDHRSYERQGVELLPTVHEGATVRAMEKKGIRTEKGEFNRWIKATNAVIRDIKKKITLLFDWIAEAKAELAKPQAPDLVSLLNAYYTSRRAGAYSQKGKVSNLKEMNETCTTEQPTEQFNIFAKAEVSTRNWLRLFFFPGIFTRTQNGTMLCLSAETETAHRDMPMCEERQTHSDRILSGLTSPIRSAMRATATSSLSLKRQ